LNGTSFETKDDDHFFIVNAMTLYS